MMIEFKQLLQIVGNPYLVAQHVPSHARNRPTFWQTNLEVKNRQFYRCDKCWILHLPEAKMP